MAEVEDALEEPGASNGHGVLNGDSASILSGKSDEKSSVTPGGGNARGDAANGDAIMSDVDGVRGGRADGNDDVDRVGISGGGGGGDGGGDWNVVQPFRRRRTAGGVSGRRPARRPFVRPVGGGSEVSVNCMVIIDGLRDPRPYSSPVAARAQVEILAPGISVLRVRQLPRGGLFVGVGSVGDAEKLLSAQSDSAFGGQSFSVHRPRGKSPAALLGMLHYVDYRVSELEIKSELSAQGFSPIRINRYRRKDGFVLGTVEVQCDDRSQFERMLRDGVRIGLMHHSMRRKVVVLQCYKCQGFNHVVAMCTRQCQTCLHCAGTHFSKECPDRTRVKCANCGLGHKALDRSCPKSPIRQALSGISGASAGSAGGSVRSGSYASVASGRSVGTDSVHSVSRPPPAEPCVPDEPFSAPISRTARFGSPAATPRVAPSKSILVQTSSVQTQTEKESLVSPPQPVAIGTAPDLSKQVLDLTGKLERLTNLFVAALGTLTGIKKYRGVREIFQLFSVNDFPVSARAELSRIEKEAFARLSRGKKSASSGLHSTPPKRPRVAAPEPESVRLSVDADPDYDGSEV